MEAAVKAYVKPKIDELFKHEIENGAIIKTSHKYMASSVIEASIDI